MATTILTKTCGCDIEFGEGPYRIAFCPLHEAAPDLLAALEEVATDYAHMCDEDDTESDGAILLGKMRAAISRARGE